MDQLQSIQNNLCTQQFNEPPDESEKTLISTYIQKLIQKNQNERIKHQSSTMLFKMPKIAERQRETSI